MPSNWLILKYVNDKDSLMVAATGFVSNLNDGEAAYGYIRYTYSNDDLSQRVKFIFVSWCGRLVKVMRKAKVTVHIAEVKAVLKSYAIEIQASELDDLDEAAVRVLIQKAGGANCKWLERCASL